MNRHFRRLYRCNGGNIFKQLLTNKSNSKHRHNYKGLKYRPPSPYPQYTSVYVMSNYVHRTTLSFSLKYYAMTQAYPIVRVDLQAVGCIWVTYSFDAVRGNSEISDTWSREWFTINVPDPKFAFQASVIPRNLEFLNTYKFSEFLWKLASFSSWYSLKLLINIYTIHRSTAVHGIH